MVESPTTKEVTTVAVEEPHTAWEVRKLAGLLGVKVEHFYLHTK